MNSNKRQDILQVKELSVAIERKGKKIFPVKGISFAIAPQKTLALVGESGSGKTMTARAIIGLLPRQAYLAGGEVTFMGRPVSFEHGHSHHHLRGKDVAMIFQNPVAALNPVVRVGIQIGDVLREHLQLSRRAAQIRVVELLENVGLAEPERIYQVYPHQLSGGMVQRVMTAMALSCSPRLLIADEPTTALDMTTELHILKLLSRLQKRYGFALLLISHNMRVVEALADAVAVMRDGEILELGTKEQVLSAPTHPYTRQLMEANFYLPRTGVKKKVTETCHES